MGEFAEIRLALPVSVVQSTLDYLGRCPHDDVERLIAAIRSTGLQVEVRRHHHGRPADNQAEDSAAGP